MIYHAAQRIKRKYSSPLVVWVASTPPADHHFKQVTNQIIKSSGLWDQACLYLGLSPSRENTLNLQFHGTLSMGCSEERVNSTPTRFHVGDHMKQVHYRDEANCSTASIIRPSAISSLRLIPREPVGIQKTKQSASPRP